MQHSTKGRPDETAPRNVDYAASGSDVPRIPQAADNRPAKHAAMRKSGHRAEVAHVYEKLLAVEAGQLRQPRSHAELARMCNASGATLTRILAVLEDGGWITRTRGGGRGNPTTFATAIGQPLPARPEPKTGAQRERERYWRRKAATREVSNNLTETEQQPDGEMSNNLTNERGTIQPEPDITQRQETAGRAPFSAFYGSDGHQEQTKEPEPDGEVSNKPEPGRDATVSNKPARIPPNPIAADPDAGAGSVKGDLSLDGFCHGSDNPVAGSGGTGPAPLHGSPTDNEGGRTVPKYMGGKLLCAGGCGKPARRACCTCWEHAYLELGHAREDCPGYPARAVTS
jgi:hypothetical protein